MKSDWLDSAKTFGICLLAAFAVVVISGMLESEFIYDFLDEQILLILPAVLAISSSTMGIVMTKLSDLAERYENVSIEQTVASMKQSTIEQLVMIGLAGTALVLKHSGTIDWGLKHETANVVLVAVFIFALTALYDVTNAVYLLIEPIHNQKRDRGK